MSREIKIFDNQELNLKVRTILNEDGSISINAEDTAIGFGWSRKKDNKIYIMWDRINSFLESFGFPHKCGKDDYIPESLFYLLGMKANNKIALQFQQWLALEVLPSIRKNGGYILGQENISDEELIAKALLVAKKKIEQKNLLLAQQKQIISELKPKADYLDNILHSKSLVTITQIAKDYGMSGQTLNEKLKDLKIQYKQNGQWLLYSNYQDKGYTHSETVDIEHKDGTTDIKMNTKWTQKGRLFLYDLLKSKDILPTIEKW